MSEFCSKLLNRRFCAFAVNMLLKIAKNAAESPKFISLHAKPGYRFRNIFGSCDFAHAQITARPLDYQNVDSQIDKASNIYVKNFTVSNGL